VHKETVAKPTLEISRRTVATNRSAEADFIVRSKGLSYGRAASVDATASRSDLVGRASADIARPQRA